MHMQEPSQQATDERPQRHAQCTGDFDGLESPTESRLTLGFHTQNHASVRWHPAVSSACMLSPRRLAWSHTRLWALCHRIVHRATQGVRHRLSIRVLQDLSAQARQTEALCVHGFGPQV